MSSDRAPNWVLPLAIGLLAFGVLVTCGGVLVVMVAGGAAAFLVSARPAPPVASGPVAIVASTTPAPALPRRTEGIFGYSIGTESTEALPARFQAPLPIDPDAWDRMLAGSGQFPPFNEIKTRACAGDAVMNAKILAGVKAMEVTGFAADLRDTYGTIYEDCDGDRACAFLEGVVTGNENDDVKGPFWLGLAYCDGPSVAKAFERPDSSPAAFITWAETRTAVTGWSKRFEQAATHVIRDGDPYEAHETATTLGATDDPRVARALVAIHAAERDPEKKNAIAFGMFGQSDATAKALFRKACIEDEDSEPVCRGEGFATPKPDLARGDLDELVDDYDVDLHELWRASSTSRRTALRAAMLRCASEVDWRGTTCLSALAAFDWAAAARLAASREQTEDARDLELRNALRRFPDRAAWIARLKSDGVLWSGDTVDPDEVEVRELLEKAGRADLVDTETGELPTEHDALLYRLAQLARPDLDGISFLELPPKDGSDDAYRIDAFLGGKHWQVAAENLGDGLDIDTCLGLLNTILEQRGSTNRFASLHTGDQTVVVVAGPKDGITRLAADDLLETVEETPE